VGGDVDDQDKNVPLLNLIDHAILVAESRRSVSLPLPVKSFVMESLDEPETARAGNPDDIFPLFIPPKDFFRKPIEPF
jgi:hypothetical protein